MLLALRAVLGVDLIVLVALGASVFARKRWVKRRPGAVRGVLVGVISIPAAGATLEVIARAEDTELLLGPYRTPVAATAAGRELV
jgi:hypothetical protein